jgi:ATP-dependent helicase/nuclease subunit A
MTVHKSKGLEFPIVIFTGCGDRFNAQDTAGDLVLHKEFGLCPMYYDLNRSFRTDSILKIAAKQKLKQEMLAEEMRILYVGATRAEQRLMFVGTARASKAENLLEKSTSLTPLGIFAANSYLDWMTAAILTDENAVLSDNAIETESWHVSVVPYESQSFVQQPQEEKPAVLPQGTACGSHYDEIAAILDFQYPYQTLTTLPSKLSVSALKDEETLAVGARVIDLQDAPRFAAEAAVLSNAQIGTLVHRLLAKLDFASLKEIAPENIFRNLEEQIVRLQAKASSMKAKPRICSRRSLRISCKLRSEKNCCMPKRLHRETPFLVRIPATNCIKIGTTSPRNSPCRA